MLDGLCGVKIVPWVLFVYCTVGLEKFPWCEERMFSQTSHEIDILHERGKG
jgi:hypothetical protein